MTNRLRAGIFFLTIANGLIGCSDGSSSGPSGPSGPSQIAQPPTPTPIPTPTPTPTPPVLIFTDPVSGFSTSDLRDVHDQILQFNTANELIWTDDGTRLPGYRVGQDNYGNRQYFVNGRICAEGCAFVVRFGTRDGERRAYLTVDYGHDNPGTLVDVELAGGALVVTQTSVYPPGAPTLSGVVTEMTPAGQEPVEGAVVYRGVQGGWQGATTDRNGFYRIQGLYDGSDELAVHKEGFQTGKNNVLIAGDTRFDVELVRR